MTKAPLTPYVGAITPEEVAAGMNAARRNAKSLVEDAEILAAASRWERACALAILSIEESGKLPVLRQLALAENEEERRKIWRDYRNHRVKNAAWILGNLVQKGARTLQDMAPIYDKSSDHPAILDQLKQITFYSDCYAKGYWSEPRMVADEKLSQQMIAIAWISLPKAETSAREVEIWIDSIRKFGMTEVALRAFYAAMKAEGLSTLKDDDVDKFLGQVPIH